MRNFFIGALVGFGVCIAMSNAMLADVSEKWASKYENKKAEYELLPYPEMLG